MIVKTFDLDEETVKTIEEIAKKEGITESEVIKMAIELLKREYKKQKRLEALERLKNSPSANIGDIDLRQIRIEKALKHAN